MPATTAFPPSPILATVDPVEDLNDADLESLLAAQGALSKFPTPPSKPLTTTHIQIDELECSSLPSSSAYTSPQPAFTDEASLDDLTDDDLDAFLEAQGALSHWPTPLAPETKREGGKEFEVEAIELLSLESPLEEGVVRLHGVIEAEYGASLVGTSLEDVEIEGEVERVWDADVDSLDGLSEDDLDSLLANQGGLRKWPTPPMLSSAKPRDSVISCGVSPPRPAVEEGGLDGAQLLHDNSDRNIGAGRDCEEDEDDDVVDHLDVATVFARTLDLRLDFDTVLALETLLVRSALSPELLALAYNVLSASNISSETNDELDAAPSPPDPDHNAYHAPHSDADANANTPPQTQNLPPNPLLQTLAAMSLAAIWAHDTPLSSNFWTRHVAQYQFSKDDLEKAKWELLDKAGGRMLQLGGLEAIETAFRTFERKGM